MQGFADQSAGAVRRNMITVINSRAGNELRSMALAKERSAGDNKESME